MNAEVVFGLEKAGWPVLLVNASGEVLMANPAAKTTLDAALQGNDISLSSIWAPENGLSANDFLKRRKDSPTALPPIKFRTANGGSASFATLACAFENGGRTLTVLQLLPAIPKPSPLPPSPLPGNDVRPASINDAALKQKLDCSLQLARTVALDFNNALTGVLAHTSLLLSKAEPTHPWRHSLLEVEKSAARAAEIAEELATFSRQVKGPNRAPAGNLNAVVGRCLEFLQNAHGSRFTWKLTPERSLFVCRFDEAKVQQALTKIFENAAESFGANGSGQIAVQIRNVELTAPTQDRTVRLSAGTYVCVEISDNGSGIEEEAMPRIFEPFFTTKRPPHRGLGLALVYGIISNHGGGVAISSQPGAGTSARVYLPAEPVVVQEAAGDSQGLRGRETVLVVDDERLVLTMAETILTDFGYRVLTAGSAQKALGLLEQPDTHVDLVITDLVMPGMGGRELAERIRQLYPGLPVMPTSGYVMSEEKNNGAGFLQKPFTSMELLRKVKAALNSRNDS